MKRIALYLGIAAVLVASCSIHEEDFKAPEQDDIIFYASFENPSEGTKVYANEDLYLRWTADDRVSIFNKLTYNQQYKFTGETGDNAGGFRKVDTDEFVTGNKISHVVSVYPYHEGTKISESEALTLTLPAEQHYAENTFGLGDNTMVSVSEDNVLQYKNVGGYLRLSLYGEGSSVSSITLKGNNGEKLAGKATVTMPLDGTPTAVLGDEATSEITLTCDAPVMLGATEEESIAFWFVVPPISFSKGFSVVIEKKNGSTFTKTTSNAVTISRSHLTSMSPFEVEGRQPNNIIYYTSSDGSIIEPYKKTDFGANIVSNNYVDGVGVITFDGAVLSIGNSAFSSKSLLTSISIPDSVTSIGNSAFKNCSNLTSITLSENITDIDHYAFDYCRSLISIVIPESVTSIGSRVFRGCSALSQVVLPQGLSSLGDSAFESCISLSSILIPDGLTEISSGLFTGCSSLADITIPESIVRIGSGAFRECTSITSLTLPSNLTTIEQQVFHSCTGLTEITIPTGVLSIENWAFMYCSNLVTVIIPNTVTKIGNYAFSDCTTLTNITIPKEVTTVGDYAFKNCTALSKISVMPLTPPTVGKYIFSGSSVNKIFVPFECVDIYKAAEGWSFYADSIVGMGTSYIYYTTSNNAILTPTISDPFGGCSIVSNEYSNGMGTITVEGVITTIKYSAFEGCSNLTSISLPETVTTLEGAAFYNCTSLASINIPENVTDIWSMVFSNCKSLTSITIPKNVTHIGYMAFYNCTSLTRVDVKPVVPPTGDQYMFTNTNLCPIYIPSGSEDAYANADYWKDYALRMRVEGNDSSLAYSSTDYSQDGKVMLLQQATVGRGINIILMGDGFVDKEMGTNGRYEQKMNEAMNQFFAYEPYYSFRNRFNVYAVKVVSKHSIYNDENSERKLTYEQGDNRYFRTGTCVEYANLVPNPYNQPLKICTVCNTEERIGRSWCFWLGSENSCSFVMDRVGPVLNHEIGGHGFGLLWDEYVESEETFTDHTGLDQNYSNGYGANVDWRSNPDEVRWAHFLKDSRYSREGLGVYEGGYLYAHGIYRATENSMMRYNDTPFNAPSREQIYKFIMKYSEGDTWVYNYEDFVTADERGRMEAAEGLGSTNAPRRNTSQHVEEYGCPPIMIDPTVKEVGLDKKGKVVLVH